MRIPSPLTESNLGHRRGSTAPRGSQGHLLRLVVLLVLVLIVMQRAADPDVYRNFFSALGVPLAEPHAEPHRENAVAVPMDPRTHLAVAPSPQPPRAAEGASEGENDREDREAAESARRLIALLSAEQRRGLTELLAWQRRQPQTAWPDPQEQATQLVEAARRADAQLGREAQIGRDEEPTSEEPTREETATGEPAREGLVETLQAIAAGEPLGESAQRRRQALERRLDRLHLEAVEDGTMWRPGDAMAFYRWLEIAADAPTEALAAPIRIGVLPLMEQPSVYRGRAVRMRGVVARSQRVEAVENPFGIERYWMTWLQPSDGSDRPVVVYSPQVPPEVAEVGPSGDQPTGPEVEITGVFLKRHLYRAAVGPELAPALIGRLQPVEPLARRPAVAESSATAWSPRLGILVALAAAIALTVTLGVAWNAYRMEQQARRTRQRGASAPTPFLKQLAADSPATPEDGGLDDGPTRP